jgi:sugar/nucleoside kinase (ribokinase family)
MISERTGFDVSAIGPLNIDLLIRGEGPPNWEALPTWDGASEMEMTAAGSVGYTVQDIARLDLRVQVCSVLSADPLGTFVQEALNDAGVNTDLVERQQGTLGGIGVYMLLFGSRKRPLTYRLPTHPLWQTSFSVEVRSQLLSARLLHTGGYLHHAGAWFGELTTLYAEARRRDLITTMDPQFPLHPLDVPWAAQMTDILPLLDVMFCDEHEAIQYTGRTTLDDAADWLLRAGASCVVIKQGADGSTVYTTNMQHRQSAYFFGELVDSIGAGDAFDTGFIYGLVQGWPLDRCARFGSVTAGFTVTAAGGTAAMPSLRAALDKLAEVEKS